MPDQFKKPLPGEYKLVTVQHDGLVTETYASGWFGESMVDTFWRQAKENPRVRYAVIFVDGGIRWEHPKLETPAG